MILPPGIAGRFIDQYSALLATIRNTAGLPAEERIIPALASARSFLQDHPEALEPAIVKLAEEKKPLDADVLAAIRSLRIGRWFHLRSTSRYSIFMDKNTQHAYAVFGLTDPVGKIHGGGPMASRAGLMELCGKYVCDGILQDMVQLGPGYLAGLNESYRKIKEAGRFHRLPENL